MNEIALNNDLIKVDFDTLTVSARDLHDGLGIKTAFKDWFPRVIEYGFTEGIDFCSKMSESTGGRPAKDYEISVDMAKQICMIQRSEKGKQYRQYFIDLEKAWNTPEQVMARALKLADKTINDLKSQIEEKDKRIETQKQEIKEKQDTIDYKEDVIIGLVDDIELAKKRAILRRVVNYKNANYLQRWGTLYREFEDKYHIDLNTRFENYNKSHKPKCKNKLDYIDKVMNKIPELYEIAVKLYENDVKALIKEMYYTVKTK